MKISRVNHTRTAVSIDKNHGRPAGIIYPDPTKGLEDIEAYVKRRSKKTEDSYQILNIPSNKKVREDEKALGNVVTWVKEVFQKKLNELGDATPGLVDEICKELHNTQRRARVTKESICDAVVLYLKKSIRLKNGENQNGHIGAGEAMQDLLLAGAGFKNLTQGEKEDICKLFRIIYKDYKKEKIKSDIPTAVKNQNMVVQPLGMKGGMLGPAEIVDAKPDGEKHLGKETEKEVLRSFLSEYADLDGEKRRDMRRRLRRMVDLYFYGMEDVPTENDFDEWADHKRHAYREDNLRPFVSFVERAEHEPVSHEESGQGEKKKLRSYNRAEKKQQNLELYDAIRKENIHCYKESIEAVSGDAGRLFFEDKKQNHFWIHHIESEVERIYKNIGEYRKKAIRKVCLDKGYLSEKVWKGILNYLSIKYIATGKALYHFAMEELTGEGDLKLGTMREDYDRGVSSFEYEQIKAEETLQRETAVAVAFAVHHLANAAVDYKKSANITDKKGNVDHDFLGWKEDKLRECLKPDVRKNLLQFFGGQSRWNGFLKEEGEAQALLRDMQQILYAMRNESFHFVTKTHGKDWTQERIVKMFRIEADRFAEIQKDKFYSNNLPMFYKGDDLIKCLKELYARCMTRNTQVPAFNTVFVREKLVQVLKEEMHIALAPITNDQWKKYQSAVYYLMKEMYYNRFLPDDFAKEKFIAAVRALEAEKENEKEKRAAKDFQDRVLGTKDVRTQKRRHDGLFGYSLPEICQILMTDQNLQNRGNRKKKTTEESKKNLDSYRHYKMLLYKTLRKAFIDYLKEKESFIFSPAIQGDWTDEKKKGEKNFLPNFQTSCYDKLVEKMRGNPELQKWYILGRLLNPKQANQLVGALRHYEQYVWDVNRRAKETGNALPKKPARDEEIKDATEVLDLCVRLNGATSNQLTDYFADEEDYARFTAHFLNYGRDEGERRSAFELLKRFSQESKNGSVSIFSDEENPILNRNVVLAKLFGNERLLKNAVRPVQKEDIEKLCQLEGGLTEYQKTGKCRDEKEWKKLREFQNLKNRVELRNVMEYTELIDELHGQLINWTYLRERDLFYFQLGFHYTCLHNESRKPKAYRQMSDGSRTIDGAILYQIAAMYINGISIYSYSENGKMQCSEPKLLTSKKIEKFMNYTENTAKDMPCYKNSGLYFDAGMELFLVQKEEAAINRLRNYIDHFHYYTETDRSLLELYSEMFDCFFQHDMKYRKNIPNMLYNILLSHFVIPSFDFGTEQKIGGEIKKKRASIRLVADGGLASEKFTYKLNNPPKTDTRKAEIREIKIDARDEGFLADVARILYFPEPAPQKVVRIEEKAGKSQTGIRIEQGRYSGKGAVKRSSKEELKIDRGGKQAEKDWEKYRENEKGDEPFGTNLGDLMKGLKIDK